MVLLEEIAIDTLWSMVCRTRTTSTLMTAFEESLCLQRLPESLSSIACTARFKLRFKKTKFYDKNCIKYF